jgi:polysaccharide pyruvyl transferase WcaK-like protein
MRILFDQSVHDHKNLGNNSLLEVARDRFKEFWPHASFNVLSIAPNFCKIYLDDVQPVDPVTFSAYREKFDRFYRYIPNSAWRLVYEVREVLRQSGESEKATPQLTNEISTTGEHHEPAPPSEIALMASERYQEIAQYDLYAPTGGGYLCDSDKRFLFALFDRLEAAHTWGVRTVMVGQGIGPLDDPDLRRRASEVLPNLDYLLIREEKLTRPLLKSLGVPPEKVLMTGDDAIEPAYLARKDKVGQGIGLSLRVAAYTAFNRSHIDAIRPAVIGAAEKYGATLVSAPIDANDADKEYIAELSKGYKLIASWRKFERIPSLIDRISLCRIMITGTFHGAVFALSQGIPVIGLANSIEYQNKLSGLAAEFGSEGCKILKLEDEHLEEHLARAIDFAWSAAERLRPQLLQNAKRQIELGRTAYRKIFSLVESKIEAEKSAS